MPRTSPRSRSSPSPASVRRHRGPRQPDRPPGCPPSELTVNSWSSSSLLSVVADHGPASSPSPAIALEDPVRRERIGRVGGGQLGGYSAPHLRDESPYVQIGL